MKKLILVLSAAFLLSACGGGETEKSAAVSNTGNSSSAAPAASKPAEPGDPELAAIYKRSCVSCHASGAANAPRTGDVAAWEPRMAKGMDVLVESAINGMGGMPPMGLCMDCNEEQFEGLINFMAGK